MQLDDRFRWHQAVERHSFVETVPCDKPILEIGPFNRPTFTGSNVRYFDVLTSNEIRTEAKKLGCDDSLTPSRIHYVEREVSLRSIPERFSTIYSSHCIEHTLDVIGHINDIANLLHDDGRYYLVVPDKRYCFDHYKELSSVGAVIEANELRPTDYSLRLWIERAVNSAHSDVRRHWAGDHGALPRGEHFTQRVKKAIEEYKAGYRYKMGPHIWCFTPESFFQIFDTCYRLGYSKLKLIDIYPTRANTVEFYAVMQNCSH